MTLPNNVQLIGRAERLVFSRLGDVEVPARIDTGARTSSIWASSVKEHNGRLRVVFFGKGSTLYSGRAVYFGEFAQTAVTSSNGHVQLRYKVRIRVTLHGRTIRAWFTLADRSSQVYPVLIGRNVLRGKFVVDVKQGNVLYIQERQRSRMLQATIKQPKSEE